MVLEKEWIQTFRNHLNNCEHLSRFDTETLNISVDLLYTYTMEQWKQLFKDRLQALLNSEFDWTHLSEDSSTDWINSPKHANHAWYILAEQLARKTASDIHEFIFPDVKISSNDRLFLSKHKCYGHLYYNNSHDRLMLLDQVFKYLTKSDSKQFVGYDKDYFITLTVEETCQIFKKSKRQVINPSHVEMTYKEYFHQFLMPHWSNSTYRFDFDELIFPLFRVVRAYFECLEQNSNLNNNQSFEILQDLLHILCKKLGELKSTEANFLYGQITSTVPSVGKIHYLLDVLSDLKNSDIQNLSTLKPAMSELAAWVTKHNPSKVIRDISVDSSYQGLEIGPFFPRKKLVDEFTILLRFRSEIHDDEIEKIKHLINLLDAHTNDDDIFIHISILFGMRDYHNRIETIRELHGNQIINVSREFLYYRQGLNRQYEHIARILQGLGFLQQYGIEDYFLLLMPHLKNPFDLITHDYLSEYPLSHYLRPEDDLSYLINLDNSKRNFEENGCFSNVNHVDDLNRPKVISLTPLEHSNMQHYAAKEFVNYPRIPKHTKHPLRASTLQALIVLVNNSMNFKGVSDESDGYTLKIVQNHLNDEMLEARQIYIVIQDNSIVYKVRDAWSIEQVETENSNYKVHDGIIYFTDGFEKKSFLRMSSKKQLLFILNITARKGHTRPNLSKSTYYKAYLAFEKFSAIYRALPADEQNNLDKISMRFSGVLRTFAEIWKNGNPDCMSAASRWFSTLILDYLPLVKFRIDIESDPINSRDLFAARSDSQRLSNKIILDVMEEDISGVLTPLTIEQLNHHFTHVSSRDDFTGILTRGLYLWGFGSSDIPIPQELLIADDDSKEISLTKSAVYALKKSRSGLFKFGLPANSKTVTTPDDTDVESMVTTPTGSRSSTLTEDSYSFSSPH